MHIETTTIHLTQKPPFYNTIKILAFKTKVSLLGYMKTRQEICCLREENSFQAL